MDTVIVTFEDGSKREYRKGVKLSEVVNDVRGDSQFDVICASYRNQIIFCNDSLLKSGQISFFDINTRDGNKIYERGLLFLFQVVAVNVLGQDTKVKVKYSVEGGIYCEIENKELNSENLKQIKSHNGEPPTAPYCGVINWNPRDLR